MSDKDTLPVLPDDVQMAVCRALRLLDELARCLSEKGAEPRICLCASCLRTAADVLGDVHLRYRGQPTRTEPQLLVHRGGRVRVIPAPCTLCARGDVKAPRIQAAIEAVDVCRGCPGFGGVSESSTSEEGGRYVH